MMLCQTSWQPFLLLLYTHDLQAAVTFTCAMLIKKSWFLDDVILCSCRFAVENLMFWLDCKEYSKIGDDAPNARLAKYVCSCAL